MTTNVSSPELSLVEVRKELDAIDAAIHKQLMKRAKVVMKVADAKAQAARAAGEENFIAFRPGREAEILRSLADRHKGPLPLPVIFRLWREIISAMTQLQTPFRVEVFGGAADDGVGLWDLARSYYGSSTPMERHDNARDVLRRVSLDRYAIGILPAAGSVPGGDWWAALASAGASGPRVVARLPFIEGPGSDPFLAYVIAQAAFEPTGDDTSLLAMITQQATSETRMIAALKEAGFEPQRLDLVTTKDGAAQHMNLFAVPGHVASDDVRLDKLNSPAGGFDVRVIGGFANPVRLSETGA
ncbi:MAG: hypothetical protein GC184_02305 [Rhizobiales bacterium]|nr:hypothetical protein [Hyphomicrobiales bacterium]